ncbi:MAG TPA: NADPH-dependent F420 reductase [Candidatus Acidoferrales bacterium]|nr:NADPH-dependent F420 reductase [Candidatus Acidoferrales bacterium]
MPDESIAIVGGTGDLGYGLALRWAMARREIVIGSRVAARADEAAAKIKQQLGAEAKVRGLVNDEAVLQAEIVVIAVPFAAQASTLASIREKLRAGQMVVDCTVPLEAALGGAPTRTLGLWAGSAAEQTRRLLPDNLHIAAAFHNVSAHALQQIAQTIDCDVVVCADDVEVRARLRPWVDAIPNCRYVDGGKLENARVVESLTGFLIGVNRRYKIPASGIRITGIGPAK